MAETIYFLRRKTILNMEVELIFHKRDFGNFNAETLPVLRYSLKNCTNLAEIDFEKIDSHDDGVIIAEREVDNKHILEITDLGGVKTILSCNEIEKEETEYSKQDYLNIIKYLTKLRDDEFEISSIKTKKMDELKQLLTHDLDILNRKLRDANWLTTDKKNYLQGKLDLTKLILNKIG